MTTETKSFAEIFQSFQKHIDTEQDLREEIRLIVRDQEQTARRILTVLQGVHQPEGLREIPAICEKARILFEDVRKHFKELKSKVPSDQYYKFHDHWRFVSQRLTFVAALTVYLETESLIEREQAAEMLGVEVDRTQGFHLDLEDFLMGLLYLADELARFAVNSVTAGDYNRPTRLAHFMSQLDLGFRLLNLKNDSLRKKFDSLKYNLKKIEEVIYDLSIRGLKPQIDPVTAVEENSREDAVGT
ncbi:translin-like [Limulus polyphemus]|uniref:Translin n=1 Tax=Limulus polyphemus TaxID=6850 RepID=A0ABM1BM36_LIMPO|nr:translin-like [Limulus polyphemus]